MKLRSKRTSLVALLLAVGVIISVLGVSLANTNVPEVIVYYLYGDDVYTQGVEYTDNSDFVLVSATNRGFASIYCENDIRLKHKLVYKECPFDRSKVLGGIRSDVPVLFVDKNNKITWSNGYPGYEVGETNTPGDFNWYADHPEEAEELDALADRKAAQKKVEDELKAAEVDKQRAFSAKTAIDYNSTANHNGRIFVVDGADIIYDTATIDIRSHDVNYNYSTKIAIDAWKPESLVQEFVEYYIRPCINEVRPDGIEFHFYNKYVLTVADFDLTYLYKDPTINKMQAMLDSGDLPTAIPVEVVLGNNWANGTATVIWTNGHPKADRVGSKYVPGQYSFEEDTGLPWGEEFFGYTEEDIEEAIENGGKPYEETHPSENGGDNGGDVTPPIVATDPAQPTQPSAPSTPSKPAKQHIYAGEGAENDAAYFSDMTSGWAFSYIQRAAKAGFVNGTGNGRFSPLMNLSGNQLVTIIGRIFWRDEVAAITTASDTWYSAYARYAQQKGLLTNLSGIDMNAELPRYAAAEILYRTAIAVDMDLSNTKSYAEVANPGYSTSTFHDAIAWNYANGVINGMGDGYFHGNGTLTREQTATVIIRFVDTYNRQVPV